VPPGALDGVTIMRYAHVGRQRVSGGVEQYLRLLDRALLQKHRLTLLQMHLVTSEADDDIETENVGLGRILWVPVFIRQAHSRLADLPLRVAYICRRALRTPRQQGNGPAGAIFSLLKNLVNQPRHLRYRTAIFSERLVDLLATEKVDLLALHWLTYDTDALISAAVKAKVPFVFINHFDNRRLPLLREWANHAASIGVVSTQGIPDDLRNRSVNLSDAVDTEFFSPQQARSAAASGHPMVLLPGRIDLGKGHHDLIKAARVVVDRKLDLEVCFAGAVDSEPLHRELRRYVGDLGLEERIHFLGEKTQEEIRDLYTQSSMVVLPSYSEGLGRVLIEAQAMEKPVVAYDGGGVSEALLPNRSGFLVRAGDVGALADKISVLLQDESARRRFGECGREFVSRQFGVSALVRRHEAFYLRTLRTSRSGASRA